MRDLYFNQSNDEVPLSKTYEVKKQRFKVLSVFNSYKIPYPTQPRGTDLGTLEVLFHK